MGAATGDARTDYSKIMQYPDGFRIWRNARDEPAFNRLTNSALPTRPLQQKNPNPRAGPPAEPCIPTASAFVEAVRQISTGYRGGVTS
jgi:hypothetical protein